MVVKEVAKAIANFFGIELKDYNSGIAGIQDYNNAIKDTGSGADKTKKKIKELKRETLSFDQIHNINENKDNSGNNGSGSDGGIGGINQALLDAIKGYDNGMDKVRMKALQIRDAILKWLGFTYDAEKGVWKLGHAYDNLIKSCDNLGKSLKVLSKYSFENLKNLYHNFLKPVAKWTLGQGLPKFVDITANGIMKTDWANLNIKLNNFYKALTPFSIHVGEGLLWFYENVLTPLGSFTIGKVIPEFIQLLATRMKILNNTIDYSKPFINFLWNNFLSPLAKWTGNMALDSLKGINSVLDLISRNKAISTILTLSSGFIALKKNSLLLKNGLISLALKFNILEEVKGKNGKTTKVLAKNYQQLLNTSKKILSPVSNLIRSIKTASKESNQYVDSIQAMILKSGKQENIITKVKKSFDNLKSSLSRTKQDLQGFGNQLSNGIKTWQNTTTGIEKFKTSIIGLTGTVASLYGVSNALKDISESGANFGNVSLGIASSLGSIASGALTGASALSQFGINGAIIGGAIGGITALTTAIVTFSNTASPSINALNESYSNYKTKIDEINATFTTTVENAEKDAEIKLAEISNTRTLISEMETLIDSNGRVKKGNEEKANVILTQLNTALGTELTLEGNVIKNGNEIVNSKKKFIDVVKKSADAIQKETLLQLYQSKYKAAIEAQTEAERKYNKILLETNDKLEEAQELRKTGKISAEEYFKIASTGSTRAKEAEKEYNRTLKNTAPIIDGSSKVFKAYADGTAKDMKTVINNTISVSGKTSETLNKNIKKIATDSKNQLKDIKKEIDNLHKSTKNSTFKLKFSIDTKQASKDYNNLVSRMNKSLGSSSAQKAGLSGKIPTIPVYQSGGFPEDGLFFANHKELVGQFSNGKTAVANNAQIVEGIQSGVFNAMIKALAQSNNNGNGVAHIYVHADKGTIVETAIEGIKDEIIRTGDMPFPVV